jgi:Uma2 family endonuclease
MTVQPWPDHLLSLEEWDALPEDPTRHYELANGVLIVAPKPMPPRQAAGYRLTNELYEQLPDTLRALQDIDVVIDASFPATVRAPDVAVIRESHFQSGARVNASDVLLAVEIISPSSRVTDRITKVGEYAEAGIPYYWIVDLTPPASMTTFKLVEGKYEVTEKATGPVTLSEPATITVDVSKLLRRR